MTRLLAVLCLVPVVATAAPAPKGKGPAYYHPTREGDTQVYEIRHPDSVSEYTVVVKKVEEEYPGGRTLPTVEVSAAGVYRVARKDGGKPVPVLKLPAKVGDSWSSSESAEGKATVSSTHRVAALDEEVEVPAGKFKAIRLETTIDIDGRMLKKTTTWYAPGVGMVKTVDSGETERTVVLKAFKPGK
jgi:hypothetical protein